MPMSRRRVGRHERRSLCHSPPRREPVVTPFIYHFRSQHGYTIGLIVLRLDDAPDGRNARLPFHDDDAALRRFQYRRERGDVVLLFTRFSPLH